MGFTGEEVRISSWGGGVCWLVFGMRVLSSVEKVTWAMLVWDGSWPCRNSVERFVLLSRESYLYLTEEIKKGK